MRTGFLSCLGFLLVANGLARAQGPDSPYLVVSHAGAASAPAARLGPPVDVPPDATQSPAAPPVGTAPSRAWSEANQVDHPSRVWFSAEYLLWWTRDESLPPLVGSLPGSVAKATPTAAQIVHEITPSDIISPSHDSLGSTSGMRLEAGAWLNEEGTVGLDASWFWLGNRTADLRFASSGGPVIGPAYFAPILGIPVIIENSGPNLRSGSVETELTQELWGVEANVCMRGVCFWPGRIDYEIGFRHLQLSEGLTMVGTSTLLPPSALAGDSNTTFDKFGTHNQFYGVQLGMSSSHYWDYWVLSWQAKVALGYMHEVADVEGSTTLATAAGSTTVPGGVLALPTNIGHYSHNPFCAVPEATVQLGFQATSHLRLFMGYNFLYLTNVWRPAQGIDGNINTFQVPSLTYFNPAKTANQPAFETKTDSFWAQGINFGAEFKF